uniref:PPFIA binding protein 1 n=1 Tax=Coturnix japonica TaxID=93934 RepID=A0A8C2YDT9_COTJA
MMSDASDMLAAALEQMDGIIAGSKALEYSNGIFDCQSPTSPFMGGLRALHLVEDLRGLLEMMEADEREGLRCQVPDSTAEALIEWLQSQMTNGHISGNGDVYQERLARLENDKESLVLQVSVLTDQVEAQGEKIRDLEFCLEEHREKLNATEEMLQQELLSRTSLETQKLDLMAEISNLKLKLTSVEKDRLDYEDRFRDTEVSENQQNNQLSIGLLIFLLVSGLVFSFTQDLIQEINELRLRVGEMDNERLQYEKKLKTTKVSEAVGKMQRWVQVTSSRTSFCFPPVPACTLLKRSQSTTFNPDDMSETEFKRGGTRATAGPRLGWSRDLGHELDMPFAKWTKEQVCNWLQDQGLGSYISNGRHWILSGQTLLQASQQDLEKELGIKHPLHRKKLQLALQALGSEEENNHGKLDYHWVTRWLDDIGLPQYKTQFDEGKVDGRMLHYMTVDDLLSLKVVSVLHHLSIKRAIQVLRINNFEPNCLRRRPSDENNVTPSEVTQWTNHRVMEWLRSVDLAEYAPNLRGSGVHGGLMVLEPRFNVETMAQLLNIPPNKTLLRRHLATHFNLLIGQEAQQQKREAMESPDYVLLTATAKVKPKKLAFSNFGSLRKKKQDDVEEYVCPMELGRASGSALKKGFKGGLDIRVYDDDDLDRLEQMEDSEGTVRQIGAFSEGINNLTVRLKTVICRITILVL